MCTTVTAEETARMDSDLRDLCDELDCLQNRANRRLELAETEFQDATWGYDQQEMIARLQKFVTTV
jgi:hypothetical protein